MLEKNEGKINGIIYEHTSYPGGKYIHFPTLFGLHNIIEEIKESKSTTEYIRINPFYKNKKVEMQMEFDHYMLYLECRNHFDEKILDNHILSCLEGNSSSPNIGFETGKILYPLCRYDDVESFNLFLEQYLLLLNQTLPRLLNVAITEMQLNKEDLAFGYFCFEIHSE